MKRDWDMIRKILTRLEEHSSDQGSLRLSDFPENEAASVAYNLELLIEAKIVSGQMSEEITLEPQDFFAERLTWECHEFLDSIRNDGIWKKTKKQFSQNGLSMTFDLIKAVASGLASSLVKSAING